MENFYIDHSTDGDKNRLPTGKGHKAVRVRRHQDLTHVADRAQERRKEEILLKYHSTWEKVMSLMDTSQRRLCHYRA